MSLRQRIIAVPLALILVSGGWYAWPEGPRPDARSSLEEREITLREGTNMAAAVSPDGETLAIDVQGRIWTLPADGGTARALTDAFGDARLPTWSPDGSRIAFQAYWDGNYHIWSVRADGGDLRQHTWGPFDDREPHWSPDGRHIAFASDRGGSYDIWVVDVANDGLERRTDHPANEFTPAWSPDGSEIAFASDRDDAPGLYRLGPDRAARSIARAQGDPSAPSWSPDGRRIAYNDIHDRRSELFVAEVDRGGAPTSIADRLEDVFPTRASWLSSDELLYTGDGKIRIRPSEGGAARNVEFEATVTVSRPDYHRKTRDFDDAGPRAVKGIGTPVLSPDGDRIAFTALGDLWLAWIGETPERLTDDVYAELHPAWSPDGSHLAFAADRTGTMQLWVRDLETGAERQITESPEATEQSGWTERPGAATQPAWSPDGREISFLVNGMVHVVDLASGDVRRLLDEPLNSPGRPTWSADGSTLALSVLEPYSSRFREGVNRILLVSADGSSERLVEGFVPHRSIGSRGRDGPLWSPDGTMFAFIMDGLLWVVHVDGNGEPVGTPRRLTSELADYPSWSGDSESLLYVATDRLRRVYLDDGRIEDVPLELSWRPEHPSGRFVVHAGGLFDGRSDETRRNMDVVVDGHRIQSVEPHDAARHTGQVVDASDGTVIPGLIEMHAHQRAADGESLGRTWLAFGVTSVREPSADPYLSMARVETARSGKRIGPRTFRTGRTFDGSRIYYSGGLGMEAAAQVEMELERVRRMDYDVIKTYVRLPDAIQKRVVEAAHEMGIPVTSHELYPAVSYGADGVEHLRGTSRRGYSPKVSELGRSYQDVVSLLSGTDMTITPTMRLYGGMGLTLARDPSLLADRRVRTLFDDGVQQQLRAQAERGGEENREALERYVTARHDAIRRIVEGGGTIVAGTDSPIYPYGLALLTEIEDYVKVAGLTPVQALRAATVNAARALGAQNDLGAIAPGMLADFVILDGDPLQNIEQLRRVRAVAVNGRLHRLEQLLTTSVEATE